MTLIQDPQLCCHAQAPEDPVCTSCDNWIPSLPNNNSVGSQMNSSPFRKQKIKQRSGSLSNRNPGHFLQPHAPFSHKMFTNALPHLVLYCRFWGLSGSNSTINLRSRLQPHGVSGGKAWLSEWEQRALINQSYLKMTWLTCPFWIFSTPEKSQCYMRHILYLKMPLLILFLCQHRARSVSVFHGCWTEIKMPGLMT